MKAADVMVTNVIKMQAHGRAIASQSEILMSSACTRWWSLSFSAAYVLARRYVKS